MPKFWYEKRRKEEIQKKKDSIEEDWEDHEMNKQKNTTILEVCKFTTFKKHFFSFFLQL